MLYKNFYCTDKVKASVLILCMKYSCKLSYFVIYRCLFSYNLYRLEQIDRSIEI